ncbi:MAG: hypothetical protein ACRDTC_15290 [Pseudonocardiaceae bacterium]
MLDTQVHPLPRQVDRDPDSATGRAILDPCIRMETCLADAQIIDHLAWLRPPRPHIRVELQHHPNGAIIAHNHGHGGADVSLSWGRARELTEMLRQKPIPLAQARCRDVNTP